MKKPKFDRSLQIPLKTTDKNMLRYVFDEPGTENDKECIQRGIYIRHANYMFHDTLQFTKFESCDPNPYAILISITDGKTYYMNLNDFHAVLTGGKYKPETQTVTSDFYFIRTNQQYSIVMTHELTAEEKHKQNIAVMMTISPDAIGLLKNSVGNHANDVWREIQNGVADRMRLKLSGVEYNVNTDINMLKESIGEALIDTLMTKQKG